MKNQFIEQDGLLFLKCEHEPLEVDSEMPCLAQPIQDDSRMGKINRISFKNNLERFVIHDMVNYISDGYYLRFEIIAKHCPDGSVGWALWQMLNGKIVMRINKFKVCDNDVFYQESSGSWVASPYAIEEWLIMVTQSGWKIYEETKPEVGKWYINKPSKKYYQHDSTSESNGYRFRQAGSTIFDMIGNSCFLEEFELAPIEPDFSNAKVGDECYSSAGGACRIIRIDRNDKPEITVNCGDNKGYYHLNGKFVMIDIHPTLFHSAAQCAAYFAEVALEERGGE